MLLVGDLVLVNDDVVVGELNSILKLDERFGDNVVVAGDNVVDPVVNDLLLNFV